MMPIRKINAAGGLSPSFAKAASMNWAKKNGRRKSRKKTRISVKQPG
jgi:hypothetical protein